MKADELAARRALVAAAILEHKTQRQVSTELGIPLGTVNNDIKAVRREWQAMRLEAVDELASEDLRRLDEVERILWPLIFRGDLQAIDKWVKIRQERAKLLGIDAPAKFDGRLAIDDAALQLIGDIIARTVTDEETLSRLRAEFARIGNAEGAA